MQHGEWQKGRSSNCNNCTVYHVVEHVYLPILAPTSRVYCLYGFPCHQTHLCSPLASAWSCDQPAKRCMSRQITLQDNGKRRQGMLKISILLVASEASDWLRGVNWHHMTRQYSATQIEPWLAWTAPEKIITLRCARSLSSFSWVSCS